MVWSGAVAAGGGDALPGGYGGNAVAPKDGDVAAAVAAADAPSGALASAAAFPALAS